MKLVSPTRSDVEIFGERQGREFSVKIGPALMEILSGLYANPVDAIVREYLTNMYDAYVLLKKKNPTATIVPPELHLPTVFEPYLEFRDFGIGMSLETVMNVYPEYNNSTKNEDNDSVGGFGLGSKAAFCYNSGQSWTVESRWNGTIFHCMAYIDGKGRYQFDKVSESSTDLPNGVTVQVPLLERDFQSAIQSARKYVPYFPMELVITGVDEFKYVKPKVIVTHDNTQIQHTDQRNHTLVMGNVPYPIELTNFSGMYDYGNPMYFLQSTSKSLIITAPIGAVDIVPSRDALKYTPKTIAYIKDQFTKLTRYLQTNDLISQQPTEWDAAVFYTQLCELLNGVKNIGSTYKKTRSVANGFVTRTVEELQKEFPGIAVTGYGVLESSDAQAHTQLKTEKVSIDKKCKVTYDYVSNKKIESNELTDNYRLIVLNDIADGIKRVMAHTNKKLHRTTRSGARGKSGHSLGMTYIIDNYHGSVADFKKVFGDCPFVIRASELDVPPPRAVRMMQNKDNIYVYDTKSNRWSSRVQIPSTPDVKYYLPLTKDGSGSNRWGFHKYTVSSVVTEYKQNGMVFPATLYGIKEMDVASFDPKMWVDFQTVIDTDFSNLLQKHWTTHLEKAVFVKMHSDYRNFIRCLIAWKIDGYSGTNRPDDINDLFTELALFPNWRGLLDMYLSHVVPGEGIIKSSTAKSVYDKFHTEAIKLSKNIGDRANQLRKKYPFISIASAGNAAYIRTGSGQTTSMVDHMAEYLLAVDQGIIN